ncbi:hypothetical protein B0H16DRAFT_1832819 [Mycena metata]|uniref:Uncharacterized protein n=1 Tax=Mycena metata TaxID=1033252 RepID=A0AAD7GQR2_9AGAR|nr:hypothetical protein B0H16DRAFT_1832819 [Mycena metata]
MQLATFFELLLLCRYCVIVANLSLDRHPYCKSGLSHCLNCEDWICWTSDNIHPNFRLFSDWPAHILDLRLRGCFSLGDQVDPKALPNLVSLDVAECDGSILGFILAPVLRRLAISFPNARQSYDLESFMTRTGASLTDLTLHHAPAREALLGLLALAPHLTSLSMGHMNTVISWRFVKSLTCGLDKQNLVPQLVSLELTGLFESGFDDSLLVMLKSRCISGPLRSARIGGFRHLADI